MIYRYSSRRSPLKDFLAAQLQGARRYDRIAGFFSSSLLEVAGEAVERMKPEDGKAGVITRTDGSQVCFIGSAYESRTAWVSNYELVWLDESEEGVRWVQEEFDALWSSPQAVDLAEAVVQDVARLIQRVVIPDIGAWRKEEARPAEPIVELPIYRRENGLWAHQKSFIKLAFDAHKNGGARYLLADQVGLGKTRPIGPCCQADGPLRREADPHTRPQAADDPVAGRAVEPPGDALGAVERPAMDRRARGGLS